MPRLIDRLAAGECLLPVWMQKRAVPAKWIHEVLTSEVVVIDNVLRYFYEVDERSETRVSDDFPNIAPPFEQFWMESRTTKRVNRNGKVTVENHDVEQIGFFFSSTELSDGWFISATNITAMRNSPPTVTGALMLGVKRDGSFSHEIVKRVCPNVPPGKYAGACVGVEYAPPEFRDIFIGMITQAVQPFLMALCFMHCKNVSREKVVPPAKLSKKWERKTGKPLLRYHVLNIEPMRAVLNNQGGAKHQGLRRALHICRGHFATYSAVKPLFGKVTGTFWKSPHVRGSIERGAVVKDYRVEAPK